MGPIPISGHWVAGTGWRALGHEHWVVSTGWQALGDGHWVVGKCYKETAAWKPEDTVSTVGILTGWTPRIPYIFGPQVSDRVSGGG